MCRRFLQDIGRDAEREGAAHVLRILVHRQRDDAYRRKPLGKPRGELQAVGVRHVNVRYNQVGTPLLGHHDGVLDVGRLADHRHFAGGLQTQADAVQHERMVIDEQHTQVRGHAAGLLAGGRRAG